MRGILLALVLSSLASTHAEARGRRFAVIVGANLGLASEPLLQYAEDDARRVLETMQAIGDVEDDNTITLYGGRGDDLRATLNRAWRRFGQAGWNEEDQLFVYISSHSANGQLHLEGTRFPLRELRSFVNRAPVGVGLLIVDACQASFQTRQKGLEPIKDRNVTIEKPTVKGRVFIASSGPAEFAHESDWIGGSYFTHHFVAAMRGAADTSHDGRVTLLEAFNYAHARTVESTMGARGGQQTPHFDMQLTGERELVLTELSRSRGLLAITVHPPGDWVISSVSGDERTRFVKREGPVTFSLSPGTWRLRASMGDRVWEHEVDVVEGRTAVVADVDLTAWRHVDSRRKGQADWGVTVGAQAGTPAVEGPWALMPGAGFRARRRIPTDELGGQIFFDFGLGYRYGEGTISQGAQGDLGSQDATRFSEHELNADLGAGLEWAGARLIYRASLRAGVTVVQQTGVPGADPLSGQPRLGLGGNLAIPIGEGLYLDGGLETGARRVAVNDGQEIRPYFATTLGFGFDL